MSEPTTLVEVDDLAARLPFVMSADERREAGLALETLSDDARHYGNSAWTAAEVAPREVRNLVLRAANRHMKNYEGFTRSTAGDEGVSWSERGNSPDERGSAAFSPTEQERLRDLGGGQSQDFWSVDMFAYQTQPNLARPTTVPDEGMGFPLFADPTEPW